MPPCRIVVGATSFTAALRTSYIVGTAESSYDERSRSEQVWSPRLPKHILPAQRGIAGLHAAAKAILQNIRVRVQDYKVARL